MTTRSEHMEWCKERALAYLDINDPAQAITSMLSDLSKHDETRESGICMAPMAFFEMKSVEGARRFIEGFN